MELICLGSSSNGNSYILRASDGDLLIECGICIQEVKKAVRWRLNNICGCLVSHEHKDHSKYLSDIQKSGIPILALEDVFKAHKLRHRVFCTSVEPMHGYKVGGFKIYTLPIEHDVPCLGFIIEHAEMGKLLFVTDTMMFPYRIKGLNHIMIEANYCDEILQQNIDSGEVPQSMRPRLLRSHMELKTTIDVLQDTDLSQVREITLLHLSARNSDKDIIGNAVREATGKPTYIAEPGLIIDISKNPY